MEEKIVSMLKKICEKWSEEYEDINLLQDGYLDSLGIMTFITEVEEQLGIEIDIDDVIPENFSTVDSVVLLLEKYEGEWEWKQLLLFF